MSSSLPRHLSRLRSQQGYSQMQVAQLIGISSQSCSHYETGRRTPDIFTLYRFSQLYHVPMEYFILDSFLSSVPVSSCLPESLKTLSVQDLSHLSLFLEYLHYRYSRS